MRHSVPSREQRISRASQSRFSFPAARMFIISMTLITLGLFSSGCVSQQTKAWNSYEEGMLLVYKGYDAKGDKVDKVEKAFNKAIEHNKDLPGVRASLGTYKAKKGDSAGATELWIEEKKIHPESKKAMDVVLEKNKGKEAALEPETTPDSEKPAVVEAKPGLKATSASEKTVAVEIKPGEKQPEPAKDEKKSV